MAVIKADAYGHGLETICEAARNQVDAFAVATIAEGIRCRGVQQDKPVVVLSELWQPQQLQHFEQYDMQVVLHNQQQLKWLAAYQGSPLSVWIKFDSGMNRLGVSAEAVETMYRKCKNMPTIKEIRLISHLSNADMIGDYFTHTQLQVFERVTHKFNCEKSLANSAAVMCWQATHFSWIRPGLMLYGVAPYNQQDDEAPNSNPIKSDTKKGTSINPDFFVSARKSRTENRSVYGIHEDLPMNIKKRGLTQQSRKKTVNRGVLKFDLKPVMQLQARLITVKTIGSGQAVGYGGIFRTRRISKIAVVGFGYGDGYPRLEDARACVLINNQRAAIIGRVSMDMITVDVTDLERVKTGDEVILWGDGLGVEEVAQWAGTIPYDLLCKVTARVPRIAIN